jgi:hypothetical protein
MFLRGGSLAVQGSAGLLARRSVRAVVALGSSRPRGRVRMFLRGGSLAVRDRGRDDALVCATPPSEPDVRFSRVRLSSW